MSDVDRFDLECPIPDDLGEVVGEYHDVRQLRLAMDKEVERVKARESQLREHLIHELDNPKRKTTGVSGLTHRAQVNKKRKPKVKENGWSKVFDWIADHDRFDMLQKRLAEKAVMDYYEETGKMPPGLETILVPELSVTKIPGR